MKLLILAIGLLPNIAVANSYPVGPNGPKTMANSTSVTMATDQTAIPVNASITSFPPSPQHVLVDDGQIKVTSYPPVIQGTSPWVVAGTVQQGNPPWSVTGGGNFTVVQPTGTNLHAVLDSGSVNITSYPSPLQVNLVGGNSQVTQGNNPWIVQGTVTANQGGAPWSENLTQIGGSPFSLGQKTMGASAPVVISSDQSPIPISGSITATNPSVGLNAAVAPTSSTQIGGFDLSGKLQAAQVLTNGSLQVGITSYPAPLQVNVVSFPGVQTVNGTVNAVVDAGFSGRSVISTVRNDYSSVNITTGAWVQLTPSTGGDITNVIEIFDSSGETLELGTGAASSEARLLIITPGGNGQVPVQIPSGTRLSLRAISATANSGEIDVNLYH